MDSNDIFTIDEVSAYLKLTKGTIYKLCQDRKIPYSKLGKQLRFRKDSIDRWMLDKERRLKRTKKKKDR